MPTNFDSNEAFAERRRQTRHRVNLPLALDRGAGTTIDMSSSGVLFETDQPFAVGSPIDFTMVLSRPSEAPVTLRCSGEVVRVSNNGGRIAIAASIRDVEMDTLNDLTSAFAEKERGHA